MLSKSLTEFSVDGWSCVPSLLFTRGQTMVEIMKIIATSFKRSHICTATLSPQLRESIPRQIDKKSMVPKERGSGALEVEIGV